MVWNDFLSNAENAVAITAKTLHDATLLRCVCVRVCICMSYCY
jgi:hypothetical protein